MRGPRDVQGRSGRVALLRTKVVLASAARLVLAEAVERRAERRALVFRRVLDMFAMCCDDRQVLWMLMVR